MKLAIITGGSKGLGKALVDIYANAHWQVVEFSRSGNSQNHQTCDFSEPDSCTDTLNKTFKQLSNNCYSEIVLINNVGTLAPVGPLKSTQPKDWQQNIQINLNACVTTTGLFLKYFSKQDANIKIANISSGAAVKPFYGWSLYCATKSAIETFTSCIALETQNNKNLRIMTIRPGVIDTQMQQTIRDQDEANFTDVAHFNALKTDNKLQTPTIAAKKMIKLFSQSPLSGQVYDLNEVTLK